jgi:GNAT superfamily N-acetyltransferase
MIKFVAILNELEIKSEVLRFRLAQGGTPRTQDFVALRHEVEVGLLIFEDWGPPFPFSFVYEVFVLQEARNDRIGSLLLSQAEMIAAKLGRSSIRLTPRSLCEEAMSDLELTTWYKRKGYIECASETGQLEKFLFPSPT